MTPRVATFRPDDERMTEATALLDRLGADPVPDPMLAVEPSGAVPREDAEVVIFTSSTGADVVPEGWSAGETTVCAIGPATAEALREAGIGVDLVPETYSSKGLVDTLADTATGRRVEIARSDHGSPVLRDGLDDVGAYHHETVLYRLVRPDGAGISADLAAAGDLDAALFTSTLTVEHFLAAAEDRSVREGALGGLDRAVVGAIGEPTREAATAAGITVDVVPGEATFEALARETVGKL
jgi:uroporphyrinogen-III synthase